MATFNIRPIEQQDVIDARNDTNIRNTINALAPYSGYMKVSKKLDNFVFQTSTSFLNKVADKNRFVKFGDKVVDTYGPELVTNGTFDTDISGWSTVAPSTVTYSAGTALFTRVSGGLAYMQQQITTVIGVTYSVDVDVSNNTSVAYVYVGTDSDVIKNLAYSSLFGYNGKISVSFTATGTTTLMSFGLNSYASINFDNVSVKEIQTADFTNTIPDVAEVITNGSNTTSVAVSAGDYVVDGSELVTNGTFDTDISGWTVTAPSTLVYSANAGVFTRVTGGSSSMTQTIPTTAGVVYTFKFDIVSIGTGWIVIQGSGIDKIIQINAVGSYTYSVIPSATNGVLSIGFDREGSFSIDNISVRRVSDTFRAKQDAPIGTALTNTTYFEDRTQIGVTNQALAYHSYNTLTNAYEGIKTEVLFSDVSKEDLLDNSVWMARNGFSKVSEFLYSKGSYLCLPIGVVQC